MALLLLGWTASPMAAMHLGPVAPPSSGYGSWGSHAVAPPAVFSFTTQWYDNRISIYHPETVPAPAASIFFAPGWGLDCEAYGELLRFLASKGYTAVCDDYGENAGLIGAQLNAAFIEAATRYPALIDTSRIGLMGHSSGAGLLTSVAYNLVRNRGWGSNGAFIFSSAPWIDFDISDAMLVDYPTDIKLVVQTYEDDLSTDLRTYIQQFESMPVPDSEKEYITLRSASIDGYDYSADHAAPGTGDGYGVFRIVEALADYTFNGSVEGWEQSLGNGIATQIEMGALPDLISTDDPRPIPGISYDYPCDIPDNPRRSHCADYDQELPASVLQQPVKRQRVNPLSPLFVWEPVATAESYFLQIRPLLANGEPDWNTSHGVSGITPVDAGCENPGELCRFALPENLPWEQHLVWWIKAHGGGREGVWSRRGYFSTEGQLLFADGFE
ncbi:alpha/beta hydrolase [Thiolapillus sp.]